MNAYRINPLTSGRARSKRRLAVIDYQISESPVEFVGALGFDRDDQGWITPRRLPDWTRNQFADAGIERMAKFPSGVRLCFRTRADQIYLHVQVSKLVITGESEVERPAAFDLLVNGQERASVLAEHGNILRLTSTAWERDRRDGLWL